MSTTTPPAAADTSRAAELVARLDALGTLPEVTTRINALVNDPDSDPDELEQVIQHDPALVARVMKVVNSAHYGLNNKVTSIKRAIVLLGFDTINRVAMAASMGQLFRGKLSARHSAKDLWNHCIAVGAVARDLAAKIQPAAAEEAFLAGISHDLGMVALLQLMPKELAAVCDTAEKDSRGFCEIERAVIGVDHEQLGAALSAAWGFPASCQSAASYHHRPAESDAENRLIVEMVHVADTLCCGERIGFSLTAHRQSVPPMLATRFGLDTDAWDSTQQRVAALAYAATTIFG